MKPLAEILEREGGHLMVLLALLGVCVAVIVFDSQNATAVSMAHDAVKELGGALVYAMKGVGARPSSQTKPDTNA
jgi:hypothetical protein